MRRAYGWCDQNQVHTASALGIAHNAMRTQLKHFGLIHGEIEAPEPASVTGAERISICAFRLRRCAHEQAQNDSFSRRQSIDTSSQGHNLL